MSEGRSLPSRRPRTAALLAAVALIGLLVGLAVFLSRPDKEDVATMGVAGPMTTVEGRVTADQYWGLTLDFLACMEERGIPVSAAIPRPNGNAIFYWYGAMPKSEEHVACGGPGVDAAATSFGLAEGDAERQVLRDLRREIKDCMEERGLLPVGDTDTRPEQDTQDAESELLQQVQDKPDDVKGCYPAT